MGEIRKDLVIRSVHENKTDGFSSLAHSLKNLEGPLAHLTHKFKSLNEAKNSFFKSAGVLRESVTKFGSSLGASALLGGIGSAFSLKTASDFESEFLKLQKVVKVTTKSFEDLKKRAIDLGIETQFTTVDPLVGMKILGMSGWDSEQVHSAIKPAIYLTGAAQISSSIDLHEVTEKFADAMDAFGIPSSEAEKFGDQLAYGFSKSNQTFAKLMDALKVFAPIAKSIGISPEEAIAHVMALADKGIKETVAGTAMAGFVARMPKLPKEAKDVITSKFSPKEYAGFFDLTTGKIKSLVRIFELLEEKRLTTGEVATIMGQEAGKYLLSLVSKEATHKIRRHTAALQHEEQYSGLAKYLNSASVEGLSGSLILLSSSVDAFAIKFSDAGLLDAATWITQKLNNLVGLLMEIPNAVLKPLGFALAGLAGLFSYRFMGELLKRALAFAGMEGVFSTFSVGVLKFLGNFLSLQGLLRVLLFPFTSTLGAIAVAISGLTYAVWFVVKNWAQLKNSFPVLQKTEDLLKAFTVKVSEVFQVIWNFMEELWKEIEGYWERFKNFAKGAALGLLGDPENQEGYVFNPFSPSGEKKKEAVHERFSKQADVNTKPKDSNVKIEISTEKIPSEMKVRVQKDRKPAFDLPTGLSFEVSL